MELTELNRYCLDYQITRSLACESSKDGRIAIITDSELVILKYKPYMENDSNTFTFDEYYIQCSDYHIADQTGIPINELVINCPKDLFYRLVMNEIFTPELPNTNPHVTKPISACWSPIGVYREAESILGAVSNTGNVEIFSGRMDTEESLINLTECLVNINKEKWNEISIVKFSDLDKCELHMKRVTQCAAACMEWSPIYERDNARYIYIAVGYFNGDILIWQLDCDETSDVKPTPPTLIKILNVDLQKITTINWCPISNDKAWIGCGDLQGHVKSLFVSFPNKDTFEIKEKVNIWVEEDVRTSKILSISSTESACFLIVKGSYIILALVDNKTQSLKWSEIVNFGNLFISGIHNIEPNYFMVSTYTGILKTLEINIGSGSYTYKVQELNTDVDWKIHAAHGLLKLSNGYLWGILLYPCKMFDHLSNRTPLEISFCISKELNSEERLKEISNEHLESHWELLDIMRCMAAKQNTLPCNSLVKYETFDEVSFYELRIIYWISKASYKILVLNPKTKKLYPNVPEPEIMEMIFYLRYRMERLKYLLNIYDTNVNVSTHQLNSIYMLKHNLLLLQKEEFFTLYFTETYRQEVNNIIQKTNNITDLPTPDCLLCKIALVDGKCHSRHPFEHCAISHVQILIDAKWHCPFCMGMAHDDIEDDNPYCPLCDVRYLPYDPLL